MRPCNHEDYDHNGLSGANQNTLHYQKVTSGANQNIALKLKLNYWMTVHTKKELQEQIRTRIYLQLSITVLSMHEGVLEVRRKSNH